MAIDGAVDEADRVELGKLQVGLAAAGMFAGRAAATATGQAQQDREDRDQAERAGESCDSETWGLLAAIGAIPGFGVHH